MLSEDNAGRIGRTLANLEQATSVLAEQRGDLSQALTQLGQLGQQTNSALAEITRLTQNANGLIDDEGRKLLTRAGESMAALERATSRLDELLSSNQGALNNGLQGFSELGPAINELRGTLGALRRVTSASKTIPAASCSVAKKSRSSPHEPSCADPLFAVATLLGTLSACTLLPEAEPIRVFCCRPARPRRTRPRARCARHCAFIPRTPAGFSLGRVLPWCPMAIRSAAIRVHAGATRRQPCCVIG